MLHCLIGLGVQLQRTSNDVIEEERYDGGRAFEFISGERFDTGDEHVLRDIRGKVICRFGGFVGHVTSGACDIGKIVYVRTLYSHGN